MPKARARPSGARYARTRYPNLIPLRADEIQAIVEAVEPYEFDRIYGGWWGRNVMSGAKEAVRRSAERYIQHIGG
jgi:hypothetical protein